MINLMHFGLSKGIDIRKKKFTISTSKVI